MKFLCTAGIKRLKPDDNGLTSPPKWLQKYGWNSTATYSKFCKGSRIVVHHFQAESIFLVASVHLHQALNNSNLCPTFLSFMAFCNLLFSSMYNPPATRSSSFHFFCSLLINFPLFSCFRFSLSIDMNLLFGQDCRLK